MTIDREPPSSQRQRDWEEEERFHWEMEEAARKEQEEKEAEEALAKEKAIDAMLAWFHEQFEDPANETLWDGEDGKYVYGFGGPFAASDVLHDQFREEYPDEWVSEAVETVERDGTEWAPTSYGDFYDHPDADLPEASEAEAAAVRLTGEIRERLEELERLLPQLPKAPSKVGHNMPPEEIGLPPYTDETEAELERHISETRGQLGLEEPDLELLRKSEGGFRSIATKILAWAGRKADLAIDETIKAGVRAGIWGAVVGALFGLADKLSELLQLLG